MKDTVRSLFFATLAVALISSPVKAQDEVTEEPLTHGDWRVACDQDQPCRMAQSVVQVTTKRLILQTKVFKGDSPTMLLSFPLGILLNTGWQYQIDGRKVTLQPFEICNSEGCHAGIKLTPKLLGELKRGKTLSVVFLDAGQTKVNPKVSLIGFTKAFEELK